MIHLVKSSCWLFQKIVDGGGETFRDDELTLGCDAEECAVPTVWSVRGEAPGNYGVVRLCEAV